MVETLHPFWTIFERFLKILPAAGYAYKKRVKNNTKIFEIPTHLSSEE